jgi:Zn-dependent protease with chaperone function/tetratricopeptide (TPR) repeat protein
MYERPLTAAARAGLVVRAAVTILLFYIAAIVLMAVYAVFALILFVVALAAARFGVGGYVSRAMRVPLRLIGILLRRLWLPSGLTYQIPLTPADAPGLFEISRELSRRSGLAPPQAIVLEMHCNAWVDLRGYRRGAGRTRLGVGFDLLAGLTVSEVEAVLAHELAHARLVQRGFSRWLKKGLRRLALVTDELSALGAAYRQNNAASDLTDWTVRVFDLLTRRAARLVATYSRQHEFEADRGAAEVCGAAAVRSGLARIDVVSDRVGSLPWSERLARLQPGEAFTSWLVGELAGEERRAPDSPRDALDAYSTHPALHDRLAALPANDAPLRDTRPATVLLADPDRVAERLVAEIQRVQAQVEKKHSRQLARDTREWCKRRDLGKTAVAGGTVLILGIFFALANLDEFSLGASAWAAALIGSGIGLLRLSRYRDRVALPIPTYGTMLNPRPAETPQQLAEAEQAIEKELRTAAESQGKRRFAMLRDASYAALKDRDYLRAHVGARLALELDNDSIEAGLGYVVAAAALGNAGQMDHRLGVIRQKVGIQTLSLKWGAAWALSSVDQWSCEGLLQQLHDQRPDIATFVLLLALAQVNRGKLQSAITNAKKGVALEPANHAAVVLLANALLLAGRTADAAARLRPEEDFGRTNIYTALSIVRLRLMQRDTDGALAWAEVVKGLDKDGSNLIALGQLFGLARLANHAARFLTAAAEAHYAPEANIGLSILATVRGDRVSARNHLLAALRFEGAKLTKGQTRNGVFYQILGRLNGLAEQRLACKAWIATFPAGSLALAGRSVLVCAPNESMARGHLETIVMAMEGNETSIDLSRVSWRLAADAQQPVRPVAPGVHSVVA